MAKAKPKLKRLVTCSTTSISGNINKTDRSTCSNASTQHRWLANLEVIFSNPLKKRQLFPRLVSWPASRSDDLRSVHLPLSFLLFPICVFLRISIFIPEDLFVGSFETEPLLTGPLQSKRFVRQIKRRKLYYSLHEATFHFEITLMSWKVVVFE